MSEAAKQPETQNISLSVKNLTMAVLDEADLIDELRLAVIRQRDAIRDGDHAEAHSLMKDIQDISFDVQAQEMLRTRLADAAAAGLECEPRVSALFNAIAVNTSFSESEASLFNEASEHLKYAVSTLKMEISVLSGLVEHNEKFGAMLLSEWKRINTGFGSGLNQSGGLDFRG
ncbi:hypothetical protein FACS1894187_07830 [Synergistales bacterium]|nr:hypothetical protein FACS1894187_07830 [Synergistales bacterium]